MCTNTFGINQQHPKKIVNTTTLMIVNVLCILKVIHAYIITLPSSESCMMRVFPLILLAEQLYRAKTEVYASIWSNLSQKDKIKEVKSFM